MHTTSKDILSGNKDKCTDHTCHPEDKKESPGTNENCTTPANPSTEDVALATNIDNPTTTKGRERLEEKRKNKTVHGIPRYI